MKVNFTSCRQPLLLLWTIFLPLLSIHAQEAPNPTPERAPDPLVVKKDPELEALQKQVRKLNAEKELLEVQNAIRKAQSQKKLDSMNEEKELLMAEEALEQQRTIKNLAERKRQKETLVLEIELIKQTQTKDMASMQAEKDRLVLEQSLLQERFQKTLREMKTEKETLSLQSELEKEKLKQELRSMEIEKNRLALQNQLLEEKHKAANFKVQEELNALNLKLAVINFERAKHETELARLNTDLASRESKEKWREQVNEEIPYPSEPLVGTRLFISDRRIPLNGPIFSGVANYVTERIHFFNNLNSEQPIFIVIDICPGGSVMEGYRIVKAMEASKAPVHVVVKSFAASMAAIITTLAKRSYAYPNAIILHHQMSSFIWGNMTQQKERLRMYEEWARRLMVPVSEKMELTEEEFIKKMYSHNSDGDWQEFADNAQKLKWVDHVVEEICETSYIKKPKDPPKGYNSIWLDEKRDENGRPFVELPQLNHFDFYHIYNPDGYFHY
ncbi:MAG: ATP-dependent Clp protease proteolytic subunit [Planctomycetes bacterium]|nr:ATP-dependent Clp protease proteolytic subunit [Planctomycetota bacterium]